VAEGRKTGAYDFVKMGKAIARKANALFKQGKIDESLAAYDEAMLENNSYDIKEAKKKVEKIKKEMEEKAYINPQIAEQHKAKGNEFFTGGDFVNALKEFNEGIKRDPSNKALYSNRCACLLKLMDPVSALKDADKCIALDPSFVKGWARKGTAHQMQKEYHKALEAFQHGLKLESGNKDCMEGYRRTTELISTNVSQKGGNDEERMAHAMADPEIRQIMSDPVVQQVLRDMSDESTVRHA
jgi:stress-induced-phosphoprotein 1